MNNVKDKNPNGKSTKQKSDNSKTKRKEDKTKKDDKHKGVQKLKEFENWDETNEDIRFKVRDLAEFIEGSLERITVKKNIPKILSIGGILPNKKSLYPQMYFFPKADGWTMDGAKKWFSSQQLQAMTGQPIRVFKPSARETNGEQSIENQDSINYGKGIAIDERMKNVLLKHKNNKLSALVLINKAAQTVSQRYKGQDSSSLVDNNALINYAVKSLLLLKDIPEEDK